MKLKIYQVDAFTDAVFSGNPAAVVPLQKWPDNDLLQKIAMENNLAETAFYVKSGKEYHIRWFTPTVEVDLCGHATLATAFVLFNHENYSGKTIHFYSARSGQLPVTRSGDYLTLNFPADEFRAAELPGEMKKIFGAAPVEILKGKTDYVFVFENEAQIRNMVPRFDELSKLKCRGVIITAKGDAVDFVSRFFAPQSGINEDPVTGSAHTTLTPYWSRVLGRKELTAIQLSERKGYLRCKYLGDRVEISGRGKLYMTGEIHV